MWRAPAASFMRALRQLGFLKLPFRQEDKSSEEDHRVLTLFRNRAELKKAYGELQDEIYRLKDRIKQQEGATQRVQEMLSGLEQRLGAQDSGYPALVFYQLRGLWQLGRELIEQFLADLACQLEDRERRAHFAEYNRKQFARRQTVEQELRSAETQVADAGRTWLGCRLSARGLPSSGITSSGASSIGRLNLRVRLPLSQKGCSLTRAPPSKRSSVKRLLSFLGCRWMLVVRSTSLPLPTPKCCACAL